MNIHEEIQKIEAEMKVLQERFSVLTGAKRAFEMVMKGDEPKEEPKAASNEAPIENNSE